MAEREIVGSVAIHQTTPTLCELRKMYLAEDWRGSGRGRKLLDHALKRAAELGYGEIWLETAHSLKGAKTLYESYGFTKFEGPHCSARCDFAMIRKIAGV